MAPTLKLRFTNIVCISILLALMGCMDELGDEGFSTSYGSTVRLVMEIICEGLA